MQPKSRGASGDKARAWCQWDAPGVENHGWNSSSWAWRDYYEDDEQCDPWSQGDAAQQPEDGDKGPCWHKSGKSTSHDNSWTWTQQEWNERAEKDQEWSQDDTAWRGEDHQELLAAKTPKEARGRRNAQMYIASLNAKSLNKVREIHMNSRDLGDDGARVLTIGLLNLAPNLSILNLEDNLLGDAGAQAIGQLLEHLPCALTRVALSYNFLSPGAVKLLLLSIVRNSCYPQQGPTGSQALLLQVHAQHVKWEAFGPDANKSRLLSSMNDLMLEARRKANLPLPSNQWTSRWTTDAALICTMPSPNTTCPACDSNFCVWGALVHITLLGTAEVRDLPAEALLGDEDPNFQWWDPRQSSMAEAASSVCASQDLFFKLGQRVEAQWLNDDQWYPGTIILVNEDHTHGILYDDGGVLSNVPVDEIRNARAADDEDPASSRNFARRGYCQGVTACLPASVLHENGNALDSDHSGSTLGWLVRNAVTSDASIEAHDRRGEVSPYQSDEPSALIAPLVQKGSYHKKGNKIIKV